MVLVFDTETTGLPRYRNAPFTDLDNWPRLVQLAWILCGEDGKNLDSRNSIVFPEGFSIPVEAAGVHGITTERAAKEGRPLKEVLEEFSDAIEQADILVAHNIDFDKNILCAEFLRAEKTHRLLEKKGICTMVTSTEYCQIPGPYGFKWPTLSELYYVLFKEEFIEAHDAALDVSVCARCFFKLKDLSLV
jgi:DNA polymerase III epsilon subunit-like protein